MFWVWWEAPYLCLANKEERLRTRGTHGHNKMGGRPVAHIVESDSGLRAKDATEYAAGGLARQTYLRRGARCAPASAVWQELCLYNGAIGEIVDIIYGPVDRPPRS